jgi:hypothetical protein
MSPTELRETVAVLGWTGRELGRQAGTDHNVSYRWLHGIVEIPSDVAAWLHDLRAARESLPAPPHLRQRIRRA